MKSLLIAGILSLCSVAAFTTPAFADAKDTLVQEDVKFVKTAGVNGMGEVRVAELGTKKAERADVKAFAETLVKDHTAANKELKALADKKGVAISSVVTEDIVNKIKDLEKESGKSFDDEFLSFMEDDHEKCVDNFEEAQKDAKDADLKAFIDKTLPVLRSHLDKSRKLQGK